MALRDYQTLLTAGVLYESRKSARGADVINPQIEVLNGTINLYGTSVTPVTPPTGMNLEPSSPISGATAFDTMPDYLYFTVATGTPIVVVSGVDVKAAI